MWVILGDKAGRRWNNDIKENVGVDGIQFGFVLEK